MQIGAVALSDVVSHATPAVLVNFSEVGLVLGIHDPDRSPANDDDVRNEMTK